MEKVLVPNLGCIASKKITEQGLMVGYMQRVQPINDLDSGWRFFSGKEDQFFADKTTNFTVVDLRTIVRHDTAVWPYLTRRKGCQLVRNNNGSFSGLHEK